MRAACKLMVSEVTDQSGVVLPLKHLCYCFSMIKFISTLHSLRCHVHNKEYVVPEQLFSVVDVNHLGAELLSGLGVLRILIENLPPNML